MTNKTLILFRHGQTDWNHQGIIQGHSDNPINDTGRQQAHALGNILKKKNLEIIVSSDLPRTVQTAEIVNSYLGIPLHTTHALREVHAGTAQGTLRAEQMQTVFWNYWNDDHPDYDFLGYPEGETKAEAKKRIFDWLRTFVRATEHTQIVICSHGRILRLLIMALIGHTIKLGNCEYVELEYDAPTGSWNIKDYNSSL